MSSVVPTGEKILCFANQIKEQCTQFKWLWAERWSWNRVGRLLRASRYSDHLKLICVDQYGLKCITDPDCCSFDLNLIEVFSMVAVFGLLCPTYFIHDGISVAWLLQPRRTNKAPVYQYQYQQIQLNFSLWRQYMYIKFWYQWININKTRKECWCYIVCPPDGTLQLPCWQHLFGTPQTQVICAVSVLVSNLWLVDIKQDYL